MNVIEAKKIDDLERELEARRQILDAITKHVGNGNSWLSVADLDWKKELRDFCSDRENHPITREEWKSFHDIGTITLFLSGKFATAYFDDAAELWQQAGDDLPMFHVMVESDRPHRASIHLLHLVNWISHLCANCYPVQFVDMQFVGE